MIVKKTEAVVDVVQCDVHQCVEVMEGPILPGALR